MINFAEALLHYFVESFGILYGEQYISHNVHNLLHICSDVRMYGPQDNFSAFRFENYMTFIKKVLRKHDKPLQQLFNRFNEIADNNFSFVQHENMLPFSCKYLHNNGPVPENVDVELQYRMISNGNFIINCKTFANNCCLLKNGTYVVIVNIIQTKDKNILIIGKKLKYVKDFDIKIMTICNENVYSWPMTDIQSKAWKIQYKDNNNTFIIFPLNHEM